MQASRPTTRIVTSRRASSPSRSSRTRGAALAYLRFAPDARPVSVPAGAHAGELILQPCTYQHREAAATTPTAARWSCPRTAPTRTSRLIALPVTRIRARSAHPGEPDLPARGRARHHQHGVLEGEPVRRAARRRPRRLPRRRRVRRARLPRGRLGAEALRRLSSARGRCARTPTPSGPARAGSRRTASTSPATRCRSASTTSRPPAGARLPPHRPDQRERRHAHGDDLLLAPPEEHPPLGDDRRQPARPLPLEREDDGRADPALLGALREGRELPRADRRPRRVDATDGMPTCPTTGWFLPIKRATCGSPPSSASWTRRRRPRRSPRR